MIWLSHLKWQKPPLRNTGLLNFLNLAVVNYQSVGHYPIFIRNFDIKLLFPLSSANLTMFSSHPTNSSVDLLNSSDLHSTLANYLNGPSRLGTMLVQITVTLLLLIMFFHLLKASIYFFSANLWLPFHAIQSGHSVPLLSSSFTIRSFCHTHPYKT